MSALLTEFGVKTIIIVILTVGIYFLASTIHERSHWLVCRIWTKDSKIIRKYGLFPASVDLGSPYDLPTYGIRLVGIAPLLVGIPASVILFVVLDAPIGFKILLVLPFSAAAILSPSDLLAFFYPKRFQAIAADNESLGHFEAVRLMIEEFRS